jgi:uncharacterized protein (DUF1800 family)
MATPAADIAHLLRRAGFGGSTDAINTFASQDLPQVVDQLLNDARADQPGKPASVADPNKGNWEQVQAMGNWWFDRMASATVPLVEKTTLFWHGHITASLEKVNEADYLWRMHATQRANALGNVRTMMQKCAIEPAMLVYLDNANSVKSSPNQNFARELLELFLLGVGNYGETEVESCARAWSGYNLNRDTGQYEFRGREHDDGNKTFMGITKNWDGPAIVDFLFDDPTQRMKVATFLSAKLWSFFAHPGPPGNIVSDLANVMVAASFEMKPVLRALFLRDEFYSTQAKEGLVRSPIEFFAGVMRASGLRSADVEPMQFSYGLGQEPFNPPNVSGWRPNKYWLSAGTAGQKSSWAASLHYRLSDQKRDVFRDLVALPVPQAVDTAFTIVGITDASPRSRAAVTNWLTEQRAAPYQEWFETFGLTSLVMLLPELQLA